MESEMCLTHKKYLIRLIKYSRVNESWESRVKEFSYIINEMLLVYIFTVFSI